jgi:pimeloyl-ACP methyl ester carboxylesterase
LFDKADFLVYSTAVNTAFDAENRLAVYLNGLPNLRLVHFVGHSLGCRVVLECLRHLNRKGGRVVLMAAAVPAYMVAQDGALAGALEAADSVLVLYSMSDDVLHYAFPPGQTIAGKGEGFLPTALGRYGPPARMAGHFQGHPIPDADHGDYWGTKTDDASGGKARSIVAGHVAQWLRLGQIARQIGVSRPPASKTLAGLPRAAADARAIPRREIAGRP